MLHQILRLVGALAILLVGLAADGLALPGALSSEFAPLRTSLTGATATSITLPHPFCILARQDDRILATVTGTFDDLPALPAGVEVVFERPGWFEVWGTYEDLQELADDPSVIAVGPPLRAIPTAVMSEARAGMGLTEYDAAGSRGQGIRVAVIDVGFSGYQALLGTELPASVYVRSFINPALGIPSTDHGAAVAEIVHDVAPEAQLFFLSVAEVSDLGEAVSWCIENGIKVVNMSLGFVGEPRDGSGNSAAEVDLAAEAGITFVVSSGNLADAHWGGGFVDADADGYMEFGLGREVIGFTYQGAGGGGLAVFGAQMIWDRWPSTQGLSLDLEIYSDSARTILVAQSLGQPSLNLAHRWLAFDNPTPGRRYYLAVKQQFGSAPAGMQVDVYLGDGDDFFADMEPRDSLGSLTSPADARGAVTVGAYDFGVTAAGANPIRYYSSQGPTWDGRTKPDIVAGDGVSTQTSMSWSPPRFYGTSASAPHVAGAAAVLSSATVSSGLFTFTWSPADFVRLLQVRSHDFGTAGSDNTYGWGGIVMPPASSDPADFAVVTAFPNPFNAGVTIEFTSTPDVSYELRIFDLLGRVVWRTAGTAAGQEPERVVWDGRDQSGRTLPSGVYFYRVDSGSLSGRGKAVLLK